MSKQTEHAGRKHRHLGANLVGRLIRRASKVPGASPGTLVHSGERKAESVVIRLIDYDKDSIEDVIVDRIEDCFPAAEALPVSWVNIDGLHDISVIESVGDRFGIHRLALEDVLSTSQRPKVEDYDGHSLIVLKMLFFDAETESITSEQVSFILGATYVFSFQEREGDVFEPVRQRLETGKGRIRSLGADYLTYALIDAIVDSYFKIMEEVGDHIEDLEAQVFDEPRIEILHRIHRLRRETLVLRRAIWPLREALGLLYRGEVDTVTEGTQVYFRDVYDHSVHVIDAVETLREVLSGAMDIYMSGVSNRMNEVMKVLTIISTIFIPLSFFAGLYGMNFKYMPELSIPWAYPTLLGFMVFIVFGMLYLFRRNDWL